MVFDCRRVLLAVVDVLLETALALSNASHEAPRESLALLSEFMPEDPSAVITMHVATYTVQYCACVE